MFEFAPEGTLPISFFNVSGFVHDSLVADWGQIYSKLEGLWEKYKVSCVMDSAFGKIERDFIIKSSQDYMSSDKLSRQEQKRDIKEKRAATSMRQTAEWGMHGLQASFPWLKDWFVYEEKGEQRITLKMFVLLFNLCSHLVGINQIQNVYLPFLNRDANAECLG